MAIVRKNSLFEALRGALGKEIVFKQYKDKTVVSRYPDMSNVQPSERQLEQRRLMREASAYASKVKRDPELRTIYEGKLAPGESVFHRAKRDFFENLKK